MLPSPRRLLIWLRTLFAAELLDDPARSVLDVAFSCGYSSDRALRRALRSTIGIAPSELRRGGAFRMVAREFTGLLARTGGYPPTPHHAPPGHRDVQERSSFLPTERMRALYHGPTL